MAWKVHRQGNLADSLLIEHEALFELDGINGLIDWAQFEKNLIPVFLKQLCLTQGAKF